MYHWSRTIVKRWRLVATVSTVVLLIAVEVYAHTYVSVYHLPVVEPNYSGTRPWPEGCCGSSDYAQDYSFTVEGTLWFVTWITPHLISGTSSAYVYLFKLETYTTPFIQSVDFTVDRLQPTSNASDSNFHASLPQNAVTYYEKFIYVRIEYSLTQSGTYQVQFGLTLTIYQVTLLGLLSQEDVRIPLNTTLTFG